jgi:hypothetical protein
MSWKIKFPIYTLQETLGIEPLDPTDTKIKGNYSFQFVFMYGGDVNMTSHEL